MSYNKNHAASIQYVEDAVASAYDRIKTWLMNNVDQLDYVQRVLTKENDALRLPSGSEFTSAYEAADELDSNVQAIADALELAGYDLTNVKLADFADMILSALQSDGVFILDANEDEWTLDEWKSYKTAHSDSEPATACAIGIRTTDDVYYTALGFTEQVKWGIYGQAVPNLEVYAGGLIGTPRTGLLNTRRLIAQYNPVVLLGSRYAIADGASATYAQAQVADVLFFDTLSDLETWGATIGAVALAELGVAKMYCVGNSTVYYYSGGGGSVAFTQSRTVPYTDTQSTAGVPAAESCWRWMQNVSFNTQSEWVSYLPSIYELGLLYLNKDSITACLAEVSNSAWATTNHWSSLQVNANIAYYVELVLGAVGSYNKYSVCVTRAFMRKL